MKSHEMKLAVSFRLFIIISTISNQLQHAYACNPYQSPVAHSKEQERPAAPSRAAGRAGRGGASRNNHLQMTTGQRSPNAMELSFVASGPSRGAVLQSSDKFSDLTCGKNADIVFDIGTAVAGPQARPAASCSTRAFMSKRCIDMLNKLAIHVMNRWPGIRLRVTKAWLDANSPLSPYEQKSASDNTVYLEESAHFRTPLHFEGRAVDITTSDMDRSKLGVLAQLASEAGFDFVYVSDAFVHASVKDDDDNSENHFYACFDGHSEMTSERGVKVRMQDVRVGDRVATLDEQKQLVYTEVIGFLHYDVNATARFLRLTLEGGAEVRASGYHVLFKADGEAVFAKHLRVGDRLLVRQCGTCAVVHSASIESISWVRSEGVFAPLTMAGTALVDDVLVSSYADSTAQTVVHGLFAPLRLHYALRTRLQASYSRDEAYRHATLYTHMLQSVLAGFV